MDKLLTHIKDDEAPACGELDVSHTLLTHIWAEVDCPNCKTVFNQNLQRVSSIDISRLGSHDDRDVKLLLRQWILRNSEKVITSFAVTEFSIHIVYSHAKRF